MTDSRPDATEVIRSEERLVVGLERVPTRIVRLEKFIVTERRTIEVEVRHEEVRLVYDAVRPGTVVPDTASRVLPDVVLSEERIEIRAVPTPVERVRLVLDSVTGSTAVSGDVRVERVDVQRVAPDDGGR